MQTESREFELGKNRIEALSDGIFAIVMTLGVLNTFRQTQIAPLFFGANLTSIGWLLYLQWAYASTQPEMLAGFVTPAYRTLVRSRFLMLPIVATLTMLVCF